jgi:hypothetical protein
MDPTSKDNSRPPIPASMRRQVRQQCYFGCVICGCPLYEYDHVVDYAEVKEHTADNLVLLCRQHHGDKTAGRLSRERVVEAQKNPFNKGRSFTTPYRLEPNRTVEILLGSNSASCSFPDGNGLHEILWINGFSFFRLHSENGWLTVSFSLTDGAGYTLLHVEQGEIIIAADVWDYKYEGTRLQVRWALKEILIDMDLSNHKVEVLKGAFLHSNLDGFVIDGSSMLTIMAATVVGVSVGCSAHDNGFGAWGLLNHRAAPGVIAPGGFGFFRSAYNPISQ